MPYPSRPVLEVLPQFRGDLKNGCNLFQRDRFDRFVAEQYAAGRSLREVEELTGRTQTAVRRSLDRTGTPRRRRGAQQVRTSW
ncbi:helix-turn-helix domain containing protein [Cellulosimicrobium sp. TH-20]|uniref:helix-turn-helix domain-containing protein n=1 Tax=Cellulosimicrobium sp. TH-20 TaxID=1980001 RepID=UPI0011A2F50E|nr:helix-turn-helix domain containing protein [Cellulosimicrobium sp. TH-20]